MFISIIGGTKDKMSVDKNLPPELVDRINTSKRRCFSGSGIIPKTEKAYTPASVHTGGWMPYTSITRNGGARMSSESRLVSRAAALTNNPSVMHTSETAHWLNRNAVNIFTSPLYNRYMRRMLAQAWSKNYTEKCVVLRKLLIVWP